MNAPTPPLPESVEIIEVGPRDGFQMETTFIPTDLKVEVIDRLSEAGLQRIEATSFVHPKFIPQMRDAKEVMARIQRRPGVRYLALVPNVRGAEMALEAGADGIRMVLWVTETYNQRNLNMSVDRSVELFEKVVRLAEPAGVPVSAILAASFGCPFEGAVPDDAVLRLSRRLVDAGTFRLGFGDSAGVGHPLRVERLLRAVQAQHPDVPLWIHLHDTRGFGLANAYAALQAGIRQFDTSLGGLGGCPVIRGATGNIATEDFHYLCRRMGLETGLELNTVRDASRQVQSFLGRTLPSRVLAAGTFDELVAAQSGTCAV